MSINDLVQKYCEHIWRRDSFCLHYRFSKIQISLIWSGLKSVRGGPVWTKLARCKQQTYFWNKKSENLILCATFTQDNNFQIFHIIRMLDLGLNYLTNIRKCISKWISVKIKLSLIIHDRTPVIFDRHCFFRQDLFSDWWSELALWLAESPLASIWSALRAIQLSSILKPNRILGQIIMVLIRLKKLWKNSSSAMLN